MSGSWIIVCSEYCLMMGFGINGAKISCANIIVLVSATTLSGKQVRICKKASLDENMKIRVLMCGRILKRLVL